MLSLFVKLLSLCAAHAAVNSLIEVFPTPLGDSSINITRETFTAIDPSSLPMAFLNLHENENTSVVAVRSFLYMNGGVLVKLNKGNSRLVSFYIGSKKYTFDPNRIYTPEGIEATLKYYGSYSDDAAEEVAEFAATLLSIYNFDAQSTVLALHNNGGTYGANSYLPGGSYENDAEAVNIVPNTNPSDFYYVVDPVYYNALAKAQYNVVLQNNETVTNDGSLSYYAGLQQKPYVNFEAQAEYTAYGKQVVIQVDMLLAVKNMLMGLIK